MSWKVLLLDDNPRSATEVEQALAEVGCEVQVIVDKKALGAAKSLSRLTPDRVDAVLVSVALPKLTGLSLFDRIHRDTRSRSIPVVLLSSDARFLGRHEASKTPAEGYVRRPADHAGLVVELGASLLAVVGAGTRTVPPPPAAAVVLDDDTQAVPIAAKPLVSRQGEVMRGRVDDEVTQPRLRPQALRAAKVPSVEPPAEPEQAVPPPPPDRSLGSVDEPSRVKQLEAELERATKQLEAERAAHQRAMTAAATEAEEALAEERAMGEAALTAMASELRAQSTKLGKKVADATARAHAAEDASTAERAGALSALAAAEEALAAKHREASEAKAAIESQRAAAEEELRLAMASRDEAAIARDELAEKLRRFEEVHEEERARTSTKLAAAIAAFDRKQRELVETREAMTKQAGATEKDLAVAREALERSTRERDSTETRHATVVAEVEAKLRAALDQHAAEAQAHAAAVGALEEALRLAHATRDQLTADGESARASAEEAIRALEAGLGDERERAAELLVTAEASWESKRRELTAARDAAASEAEARAEEVRAVAAARDAAMADRTALVARYDDLVARHEDLTARYDQFAEDREQLQCELEVERERYEAIATEKAAAEELGLAAEKRATEERATAADELAAVVAERATAVAELAAVAAERTTALAELAAVAAELATATTGLAAARTATEAAEQALAETQAAAAKQTAQLEEDLRVAWATQDELTTARDQLQQELEAAHKQHEAALREREELDAAAGKRRDEEARVAASLEAEEAGAQARVHGTLQSFAATTVPIGTTEGREGNVELLRENRELEARLEREIALRRADQEVAVAALRTAEERILALEARNAAPSVPADRISIGPGPSSGEPRARGRTAPPDSFLAVPPSSGRVGDAPHSSSPHSSPISSSPHSSPISSSPISSSPFSSSPPRSSGPPPRSSGHRLSARAPASLEGDRDDTRPPGRRAVLLIDGDKAARTNTARALARASCEVTVCDSCADLATVMRTHDVIVTEVVGVGIEKLLQACRETSSACAIVVWTPGVENARALFEEAGMKNVLVLQKTYRADELVTAVRARLDDAPNVAQA